MWWQPILELVIGLVVLSFGAEWLIRSAVKVSGLLGIPAVIIGLTVVSFGTSAPELAVSILSSAQGQSDVAIGNVVGSNIFNIFIIIGLSAMIKPMSVHLNLIRIDTPILVGLSLFIFSMAWGLRLSTFHGVALLGLLVGYIVLQYFLVRKEQKSKVIDEEFAELLEDLPQGKKKWTQFGLQSFIFLIGLALLVFGSRWFVNGSVELARLLGWSELIIGLTLVALGTSIPEVATSVVAAIKGHHDIAIANAIGSNVFNILAVLGTASVINPLDVSREALLFDFPVMISAAVICWPIFVTGRKISRWEGGLLIAFYMAYSLLLYFREMGHVDLGSATNTLYYWILPLGAVLSISYFAKRFFAKNPA